MLSYAPVSNMTKKIDLKKTHKQLFSAREAAKLVDVPPLRYFMIDGEGPPEDEAFQEAIQALYSTAYTLKFAQKKAGRTDFVVAPLEALWWSDDPRAFAENRREEWRWTAMVMQPDHVEDADIGDTLAELQRKGTRNPAHDRLRLETLEEGRAAQLLYVGPYNDMGPSVAELNAFAAAQGYQPNGRHHDIYLSDPRRTTPEKLKTILRQPVAPAS